MSHVYGENWEQFEERMSLERAHQKLMDVESERKRRQQIVPTKQPTLRCCYNCKFCEAIEYESTFTCHHPLVDTCVEPTEVCGKFEAGVYK